MSNRIQCQPLQLGLSAQALGVIFCLLTLGACSSGGSSGANPPSQTSTPASPSSPDKGSETLFQTQASLGEALFFDTNLSLNRTQACATCHNPDHAFMDRRPDHEGKVSAVSLGDDGTSVGDRNTPTAAYAALTPAFNFESHPRFNSRQPDYEGYVGGQFMDGRALDLESQAAGPLLNPLEMGMPDMGSVVTRLRQSKSYEKSFAAIFGAQIWADEAKAYGAATQAIAAFERTDLFSPFTSKYDRYLAGDYTYDPLSKSARGKALFFSQQFTNCATCHQLRPNSSQGETFSNFEYHNIGVPPNTANREFLSQDTTFKDRGLAANPAATGLGHEGKFKVPTLRNVAVTGPYMHNGVFKHLRTVVEFYDHFLTASSHKLNPETGLPWAQPETPNTLSVTELEDGGALTTAEVESLVCFLYTLTDARYEHLITAEDGIDCAE